LNQEFRDLVEGQMAKDRETQGVDTSSLLAKLNDNSETKRSPSPQPTNLMPSRPPLTSSTSENLMNLACQGPEDLKKVDWKVEKTANVADLPAVTTDTTTADWSMKVNEAQAAMAEAEDSAWLARLPRQLS